MFELGENALAVGFGGFDVWLGAHGFESGTLFVGELFGYIDHYVDKLVTSPAVLIVGQALSAQTEHFAGLSAGRNVDASTAGDRWHFDSSAEGRGWNVEHQVINQVGTIADELGMLDFFNHHEEVAGCTAPLGIVTFSPESESLALGGSGRNRESHFLVAAFHALSVAVLARFGDNLARAFALWTNSFGLHVAERSALHGNHASRAMTFGAGRHCHAIFGTCAVAVCTFKERRHTESLCHTLCNIFEREFDTDADIAAAFACRLTATASCGTAETAKVTAEAAPKDTAENIVEIHSMTAIEVVHVETAGSVSSASKTLRTHVVAVLVVELTFFLVAEHIVGLGSLLEFLLGLLVARILIRVILNSLFAIGFLYFVGGGSFAHTEHFVVISFAVHIIVLRLLWHVLALYR